MIADDAFQRSRQMWDRVFPPQTEAERAEADQQRRRNDELATMLRVGLDHPDLQIRSMWQAARNQPLGFIEMMIASGGLSDPREKRRGRRKGKTQYPADDVLAKEYSERTARGEDGPAVLDDMLARIEGGATDDRKKRRIRERAQALGLVR